jgi:hypothetical protein
MSEPVLAVPGSTKVGVEEVVALARPAVPAGEGAPRRLPIQLRISFQRLGAAAGVLTVCRGAAAAAGRVKHRTARRAMAARRRTKVRDIEHPS